MEYVTLCDEREQLEDGLLDEQRAEEDEVLFEFDDGDVALQGRDGDDVCELLCEAVREQFREWEGEIDDLTRQIEFRPNLVVRLACAACFEDGFAGSAA